MALDLSIVGRASQPATFTYDWKTLATYALGVGAKKGELAFLYEGTPKADGSPGGMKVLPSFAVVPAYAPVMELLAGSGGDMAMVVHGAQTVRVLAPPPPSGTVETVAKVDAVYDLKKFAQVILSTESRIVTGAGAGAPVFATSWSIIYRGAGGFGGPRPPESEAPSVPKDREPTFTVREATTPEQALLYRLSGDPNPLHADPAFAEKVGFPQGPILHGLCTFGFACRAVLQGACGGEPARMKSFSAQFRRPVWPGDTLVTRGFALDGDRVAIDTRVEERDESVLANAWAQIAPG
jgi:acyl dehydratase